MSKLKPIRRSDGKTLGDGRDADEKALERLLSRKEPALPKQNDWSKQVTRNGEPVSERGRKKLANSDQTVKEKTWEEYKQELFDYLQQFDKRPDDQGV